MVKGTIIVLNKDLFFGVKIGNILRSLGYSVKFVKTGEAFSELLRGDEDGPVLGIIDINAGVDWEVISDLTGEHASGVPILAFGSHLDVNGLKSAKAAGVRRTVSNGDFHRDMVKLVTRYATPTTDEPNDEISH